MKVIFLDIDGVLQPYKARERFEHDLDETVKELSEKYNIDYTIYNKYDVGACYYDWDVDAVNRIKKIIEKTGAKIVISSDWRMAADLADPEKKQINKMLNFLRLWGLEEYLVGENDVYRSKEMGDLYETISLMKRVGNISRTIEILNYLKAHEEIKNYVILDDTSILIDEHFVKTKDVINDYQMKKAIKILNDKHIEIHKEY